MSRMQESSPRPPALGFIFVTLVLLVLGFGIIIPILPGLVTQFEGGRVSEGSHAYGWLIMVFALMQFVGSPILGALSVRFGRLPGGQLALRDVRPAGITSAGAPADVCLETGESDRGRAAFAGARARPAGLSSGKRDDPRRAAAHDRNRGMIRTCAPDTSPGPCRSRPVRFPCGRIRPRRVPFPPTP